MDLFGYPSQNFEESRERDACETPGDPVAELAAMVEAMAERKSSTRQIVEAVRDFAQRAGEARIRRAGDVTGQTPAPVWIPLDSPEWRAWAAHYRETRNRSPPLDRRGGWRFPYRWPPNTEQPET